MMKEKILSRLDKLEEALREENVVPMVAMQSEQGIEWNGVTYPDEGSLHEARETICGRNTGSPLVIIGLRGNGEKDLQ